MEDVPTRDDVLARFYELTEARRRRELADLEAASYRRIVRVAGIDPSLLTDRGRRTLRWLAASDEATVDGIVDILVEARSVVREATLARRVADRGTSVTPTAGPDERRTHVERGPAGREPSGPAPEIEGPSL